MNLNLINLPCDKWSRTDWQDAYAQYCQSNAFGSMSKREYYDFVRERHKRFQDNAQPLSDKLKQQWSAGRRAAAQWAKKRGCDMNGRLLTDVAAENKQHDVEEMADDIKELQWRVEMSQK